jgi:hypothetical protein
VNINMRTLNPGCKRISKIPDKIGNIAHREPKLVGRNVRSRELHNDNGVGQLQTVE